jgi:arabinofuranosyltransferase
LVPNTFYAKVGGISEEELILLGIKYLIRFLIAPPFLAIFSLAAALWSIHKHNFAIKDTALWGLGTIMVFSVVASGGDHMPAFRFFLPLVPLLTVFLVGSLYQSDLLNNARFTAVFMPALIVCLLLQSWAPQLNPEVMDAAASVGTTIGRYIHLHWSPGSTVALNCAGSTPYFADDMQYIDMLGLNDAMIARRKNIPRSGPWNRMAGHLKGDGASVLARRPDYIILGPSEGTTPQLKAKVYFIGDYEIGTSPIFQADYEVCTVMLPNDLLFTYYQRRDEHRPCPAG